MLAHYQGFGKINEATIHWQLNIIFCKINNLVPQTYGNNARWQEKSVKGTSSTGQRNSNQIKVHTDDFLQALSTHSANSRVALSSADNENRWTASSPISNFAFCMQLQKGEKHFRFFAMNKHLTHLRTYKEGTKFPYDRWNNKIKETYNRPLVQRVL